MRFRRLLLVIPVVTGSVLAVGLRVTHADLTVDSWELKTTARDGFLSDTVTDSTVLNPFSETRSAIKGGSESTTIYDFDWTTGGGTFDWEFDHSRAGSLTSDARSFGNNVRFTITGSDMNYDLSGAYTLSGKQRIFGKVFLRDITAAVNKFDWRQESRATDDDSFLVGRDGDGDFSSPLTTGSTSGTLLKDHTYDLFYDFFIGAFPAVDSGATALGELHMSITPIPAPGAGLLGIIGLAAVRAARRRIC